MPRTMKWRLLEFEVEKPQEISYQGIMIKKPVDLILSDGTADVKADGEIEPIFPEKEFDVRWCERLSNNTFELGAAHYGEHVNILSLYFGDWRIKAYVTRPKFFDEDGNDITPKLPAST